MTIRGAEAKRGQPSEFAEIGARFGHWRIDVASWTISWSVGVAWIFGRPLPPTGRLNLDEHIALYHADDVAAVRGRILLAINEGKSPTTIDYNNRGRVIRPGGEVRDLVTQGVVEKDPDGTVTGIRGIVVDITETLDAERKVREGGALLRTTLEHMDQGILMLDRTGRIVVQNERARRLLSTPGGHLSALYASMHEAGTAGHPSVPSAPLPPGYRADGQAVYDYQSEDGAIVEVRAVPLPEGGVVRTFTDITSRRAADAALKDSERRYRLLAEHTTDTIILCDLDSTRRYVSPGSKAMFGYEPEELVGTRPIDFAHPDDIESYQKLLADLRAEAFEAKTVKQRYRRKDGSYVWVEICFSLIREGINRAASGWVAALRDISDRMAIETALRESEERLSFALDSGGDGLWDLDFTTGSVTLAGRWWSALGYGEGEIEPTVAAWHALVHPEDAELVRSATVEHLKGLTPKLDVEYRIRKKNGGYVWALGRGKVVERDAAGRATRLIGTHMDITRRKDAERMIAHLAHHDALTELPNRALFRERLDAQISAVERHGCGSFALLACDLDRFKAVNDTMGHAAGDQLLRAVAARLRAVIRAEDVVARLGGDEFTIILTQVRDEGEAITVAHRVIDAISPPVSIGGQTVVVGVSIGIVVGPHDGRLADELCRRADMAMYLAKAAGRNTFRRYEPGMESVRHCRSSIEADLLEALKRGTIDLGFHPIVDLCAGRIHGFEIEPSWDHPSHGLTSGADLMSLAEQAGLDPALGDWTLRSACAAAAAWRGRQRILVAATRSRLLQRGLAQSILSALAAGGLPPARLTLAVRGTALADRDGTAGASLLGLQRLGVRLALHRSGEGDDGPNGFPFDEVVFDRSFLRTSGNPKLAAAVRAVVGTGGRADALLAAKGLERREDLDAARRAGCQVGQGLLFSRPLCFRQAAALVAADGAAAAAA